MIQRFFVLLAIFVVLAGLNACCCSGDYGKTAQADFFIGAGEESLKQGNYDEAKSYFKKAIEIQPAYPSGYYYRGKAFKALGNEEMANKNFEKALTLYKEFLKTESDQLYYNELADLYENLGRNSEAIDVLDKLMTIDPGQRKKIEKKIKELKTKIKSIKENVKEAASEI